MARPLHPLEAQRRTVARHLRRNGATVTEIATVLGLPWASAKDLLRRCGDDPAPDWIVSATGKAIRGRRPPALPQGSDTTQRTCCLQVDGHDPACLLARAEPEVAEHWPLPDPRYPLGRGAWPAIIAKLNAGHRQADVARWLGVRRQALAVAVMEMRAEGLLPPLR